MAGTREGGIKSAKKTKENHGDDFFRKIGAKGGSRTHLSGAKPKGFATNPELARISGAKGGRISRRGKARKEIT